MAMGAIIAPRQSEIALVETDAPEFFVSGLARVESLGSNARFVCYGDYVFERRVTLTVIVPKEAVGPAIELTIATLGADLIFPMAAHIGRKLVS
jgi:hypothetical protein